MTQSREICVSIAFLSDLYLYFRAQYPSSKAKLSEAFLKECAANGHQRAI